MLDKCFNKKVIIAPLNWGLGHACRCIPIIRQLVAQGNQVLIASDGEALDLLKIEFPNLETRTLPSYNIRYTYSSMVLNMVLQGPRMLRTMRKERKFAAKLINEWQPHFVISDNRFGFRKKGIYSIYISHQIMIPSKSSIISKIATNFHTNIIEKYDQCWVPDHEPPNNLAGAMSEHGISIKKTYIGPLSRMTSQKKQEKFEKLIILSGPEPMRTKLEKKLVEKYAHINRICMVRGTTTPRKIEFPDSWHVNDLLPSQPLNDLINESKHVVCRAGYTSIMDLKALGKSATLIPTPGQYEQEYLAERLDGKFGFSRMTENEL